MSKFDLTARFRRHNNFFGRHDLTAVISTIESVLSGKDKELKERSESIDQSPS